MWVISTGPPIFTHPSLGKYAYRWQIDIWHNDAVQCAGGILWCIFWVPSRMILVLVRLSRSIVVALPRHTASSNVHFALRGRGCWLLAYKERSITFSIIGTDCWSVYRNSSQQGQTLQT